MCSSLLSVFFFVFFVFFHLAVGAQDDPGPVGQLPGAALRPRAPTAGCGNLRTTQCFAHFSCISRAFLQPHVPCEVPFFTCLVLPMHAWYSPCIFGTLMLRGHAICAPCDVLYLVPMLAGCWFGPLAIRSRGRCTCLDFGFDARRQTSTG